MTHNEVVTKCQNGGGLAKITEWGPTCGLDHCIGVGFLEEGMCVGPWKRRKIDKQMKQRRREEPKGHSPKCNQAKAVVSTLASHYNHLESIKPINHNLRGWDLDMGR